MKFEKASDALRNLLLGVLDKATLTLGDNRRVELSGAVVFLTSNLGAEEMAALCDTRLGFCAPPSPDASADDVHCAKVARAGVAAARRKFTPEFVNRLDRIVVFRPLGAVDLRRILKRAIERLLVRPLANLLASGQIGKGDWIGVSHADGLTSPVFSKEATRVAAWRAAGVRAA